MKLLEPGLHMFRKFQRMIKVEHVDRRVQTVATCVVCRACDASVFSGRTNSKFRVIASDVQIEEHGTPGQGIARVLIRGSWAMSFKFKAWRAYVGLAAGLAAFEIGAQTIEDEFLLPKSTFLTGVAYSHDSWREYWEGVRKRDNGNIGTLTTETATWTAGYGVTSRLTVLAYVPHVWTHASLGVLRDMKGFQDLTVAAKYHLLDRNLRDAARVRMIAVVAGSLPLSDYTADFMPLSIGTSSKQLSGRLTANLLSPLGWCLNLSAAYTGRDDVELDRPFYFTDDRLFMTNEVEMPDVVDYSIGAGYSGAGLRYALFLAEQRTRGGGDIRRQDMPFVSNRMDYSKAGAMFTYAPQWLPKLELRLNYAYTLKGRNVGQSTTVTTGFTYKFDFGKAE